MTSPSIDRRTALGALLCAAATGPAFGQAPAAPWRPTKPINLIVSVAPGSSVDIVARILADRLQPVLGQPLVVQNKPGASGLIAASGVARADPDGYTLLIGSNTMLGAPHTMGPSAGSGLDILRDLNAFFIPATSPMVIMANPSLGVKTPQELIAYLRRHPGLPYATAGNGSPFHFAGEMFKAATKTDLTHAPYRGVMPAVVDTLAGTVMLTFGALGGVTQFIEEGKLVPLAVGDRQRSALLPNVPTLREAGIPIDFTLFFPVFAPAKTPKPIIDRLNREMATVMQLPEVKARLLTAGVEARSSTVEEAHDIVADQYRVFARLAKEFNIRSE